MQLVIHVDHSVDAFVCEDGLKNVVIDRSFYFVMVEFGVGVAFEIEILN